MNTEKILGVLRNPLVIAAAGYLALGLSGSMIARFIDAYDTIGAVLALLVALWICWAATCLVWRRL